MLKSPDKIDEFSDLLYRELRCGLFHESGPRGKIVLQYENPISLGVLMEKGTDEVTTILICPSHFVYQVVGHFEHYIEQLRDPANASTREMFERVWDQKMKDAFPIVPPSGILPNDFSFGVNAPKKAAK